MSKGAFAGCSEGPVFYLGEFETVVPWVKEKNMNLPILSLPVFCNTNISQPIKFQNGDAAGHVATPHAAHQMNAHSRGQGSGSIPDTKVKKVQIPQTLRPKLCHNPWKIARVASTQFPVQVNCWRRKGPASPSSGPTGRSSKTANIYHVYVKNNPKNKELDTIWSIEK